MEPRHQQLFEDAFMNDLPSSPSPSPSPSLPRPTPSVVPVSINISQKSSKQQRGKRSPSNSFHSSQQSVKLEGGDVDLYAVTPPSRERRHGTIQPSGNLTATTGPVPRESSEPGFTSPLRTDRHNIFGVQRPRGPSLPVDEIVSEQAYLKAGESDDDDIMIIDEDDASPEAQRKWREHQSSIQNDEEVFVKRELKDDLAPATPLPAKQKGIFGILAQQRAIIGRARKASPPVFLGDSTSETGEETGEESIKAEGSDTNSKEIEEENESLRYETPPIPDIYLESRDDSMLVDAAMLPSGEDNSWMEQDDEVDEEYESMKADIVWLEAKQRNKSLNGSEKMQLFKLGKRLAVKERLRGAANHLDPDDEEESLFVADKNRVEPRYNLRQGHSRRVPPDLEDPDYVDEGGEQGEDNSALFHMLQQELDLDAAESSSAAPNLGLTKGGKPKKQRAKNAREHFEQEFEQSIVKERKKSQKKRARTTNAKPQHAQIAKDFKGKGAKKHTETKETKKKKAKKSAKGKAKGKAKKGTVKNGKSLLKNSLGPSNGTDIAGQMILDDLMISDPIQERLTDPIFNLGPEPAISERTNKESQFQKLFANIPEGDSAANKVAKDDQKKLREASKSFGHAQCKAHDGKWLINGMKTSLYHHQLLGAQWMLSRELSSQAPNGGLLADSMGLGKTVQMLACMVANLHRTSDHPRGTKATLIVVPAAVVDQWLDEIRYHTEENLFPKIMHYKTSAKVPQNVLEDLDIVITSYQEVMKQYPFPDAKTRANIQEIGLQKWWENASKDMGVLHQINWYRVVLDEAQAIKNNSGRTSMACQNLKGVYKWCLTGTPLLNRLEELFPYLRFLKADYTMNWTTFQKYFCDVDAEDSYSRITTLLSYTMMRRTMKTTILGRPIITLPKPHPQVVYIQFSPEEQIIYRITENRFRTNLNVFFAKGEARRNYGVFMVQLLRLRQCTGHLFMLERVIKESWTREDVAELQKRLAKLNSSANRKPFYEQCKVWVEESEKHREDTSFKGKEVDNFMVPYGKGDYGSSFNFMPDLSNIEELEELSTKEICPICLDVLMDKTVKTDCGHIFCEECLNTFMQAKIDAGEDPEFIACPTCQRIILDVEKVKSGKAISKDDDNDQDSVSCKGRGKYVSKGIDALGFEPATHDSSWITKSDKDPNFPLVPSSKTLALKSILWRGFEEAPLDKVVIYVQFRALARIVGRICKSEDWGFLYLTGDSSTEHRAKVIRKFRDDPSVRILIAGLKCGGLGLNFPFANRCISLDLWWNHAVEQQAFGRIFRIGQNKETYMTRLVVRNSVDVRMMAMQLNKLKNLDRAMRDGEHRDKPLSLKQLANLFGFLKTDYDDNIISVEPDYQDEHVQEGEGSGEDYGQLDIMMGER